jgi:phage-related protein
VLLSDLVEALGHRVSAFVGEVVQAAFFLDQACSAELFEGVPEPVRQSSAEVCTWKTYRLRQLGAAGVSVTQRQQDRLFKRRLIHLRARVRACL